MACNPPASLDDYIQTPPVRADHFVASQMPWPRGVFFNHEGREVHEVPTALPAEIALPSTLRGTSASSTPSRNFAGSLRSNRNG